MNVTAEKTWSTTKTGMTYHSFNSEHAVCRKNIKKPVICTLKTEAEVDAAMAQARANRVWGFSKCESCTKLEAQAAARLEASMEPSTGEGDYLAPAEIVTIRAEYTAQDGQARHLSNHGRKAVVVGQKHNSSLLMVNLLDADGNDSGEYTTVTPDNIIRPGAEAKENDRNCTSCGRDADKMDRWGYALHADDCSSATSITKRALVKPEVSNEVIEALRTLRTADMDEAMRIQNAIDVLDNAGIFAEIDEATGYDVDPAPERVSKCNCGRTRYSHLFDRHASDCPGDPAEWGDLTWN